MRIPTDNVIVKMVKTINDEYKLKNGKIIYLDTYYDPAKNDANQIKRNLIICAEAIEVPEKLAGKHRRDAWPVRSAAHVRVHRDVVRFYKFDDRLMDSIVPEVEKGDLIYFNWTTINDTNLFTLDEDEAYYRVPYPDIICTVKKGKIIPIGGNLLIKPYYGEGEFRQIGNLSQFGYKNDRGLFTLVKPMQGFGEIVHAGKPLIGDVDEYRVGDIVKYTEKMGYALKVEEEDYINIRYWDIVASFEKVA